VNDKGDIDHALWREELERLIKSVVPLSPGGVALSGKGALFVDEIAKAAYMMARKLQQQHGGRIEPLFAHIFKHLIEDTTIHELGHLAGLSEPQTKEATRTLLRKKLMKVVDWMVWSLIPCPKKNRELITWTECLKCTDDEKDESCPLWSIRQDLAPRQTQAHTFHVTELTNPRKAYYERTEGHAEGWDEKAIDFFVGRAVHNYIQTKYAAQERELFCWWDLGDIRIIGSADRVDIQHGILFEYKTYATLAFLLERNKPEDDHVYQAQSYIELLKHSHPWIKVKKIKIVYIAKAKEPSVFGREQPARYKEFVLEPKPPEDLVERARMLDAALEKRKPPKMKCADWMCKLCGYAAKCKEAGSK